MKLLYRILLRISLALTVVLALWTVCFYIALIHVVNDEVDESLESYSETILIRQLAGEELPSQDSGSNNQYYLRQVSPEYAGQRSKMVFSDSLVYVRVKDEREPARILKTIFEDAGGTYHELIVSTPSIEKDDLKEAILGWIVFLYVVMLFTIIVITFLVFRRNMKPLYVLLRWLDDYRTGGENRPLLNETRVTEFRKLNEAAIRNAKRNEEVFEQQKQFIGNASHEMQTPLAICRNRLEILMEDESLTETQLEDVAKTYQTLEHLIRLNRSLLFLSKIDNGQFPDTQSVEINKIVKRHLEDFKEVYAHRKLDVSLKEAGILSWQMSESLAIALITNLLKNAFAHNVDGGKVCIELTTHSLAVRNTATAGALNERRLFERFYQSGRKEGSTGLGLAISDAICRLYHLRLQYSYSGSEHCFLLSV